MATKTSWQLELPAADTTLQLGARPLVMGVLNLTPDSFSDGGHFLEVEAAVAHAERLLADGADLLDLGAESTRPGGGVYGTGARDVPASEELDRLLPVLDAVRTRWPDVPLSVDTRKGAVARRALEHGADLINDVGGLSDPEMVEVMTQAACPIVLMHSRGELGTMQTTIDFADVVAEVRDDLAAAVDRAAAAGVARDRLILDPGLGFGKTAPQNL
ncbi:MAG: dihydropteroate synthase, partial [Acidobacteriota bacterium]